MEAFVWRTLMRIHVEEQDKHRGKPVYESIVELLRKRKLAGATVYRAIEGFGASGHVHEDRVWTVTLDVPIVIECIDTDEKIQSILPELDTLVGGGVVTLERVRVRGKSVRPDERDQGAQDEEVAGPPATAE